MTKVPFPMQTPETPRVLIRISCNFCVTRNEMNFLKRRFEYLWFAPPTKLMANAYSVDRIQLEHQTYLFLFKAHSHGATVTVSHMNTLIDIHAIHSEMK